MSPVERRGSQICGLAGFVGIRDPKVRRDLVDALGAGIDPRGGHASGYVNVDRDNDTYVHAKRVGSWTFSKNKFRRRASHGDMAILHSRWATCGNKNAQDQAHPYAIRRNGEVKLIGAQNGQIWNAEESAKFHNRPYDVDSRELFELMADGNVEGIQDLDGYGVINWFVPGTNYISLVRLSSHSEICVCSLKQGGIAWASTWDILRDALEYAELEADYEYNISEVGRVYHIRDSGVYRTPTTGISFDAKQLPESVPETWEKELWAKQQEQAELEEVYRDMMMAKWGDDKPMFDEHLYTTWEREKE